MGGACIFHALDINRNFISPMRGEPFNYNKFLVRSDNVGLLIINHKLNFGKRHGQYLH